MSYKALYRKYRPTQFDDVVGQEHIIKTLKNIIEKDKVSHAYLFAGPRGTGKTSIAHIFAKNLNCKDQLNKTVSCGKCESCLAEGNIDIIEIDAASNNGVSEVRSIIDNSRYSPSISKYKVYIIDEVHMLSKGAFNALLKTLEEPPSHVIFILATTEPHKIPVTILSRTQRFNFRRISNDQIISRLSFILEKENIDYEESALKIIANMAKGGMRDAISITDQVSSYSQNQLSKNNIHEIFGILSAEKIIDLINGIKNKDAKFVLNNFDDFINRGYEVSKLTESIIDVLKEFIIYKKTDDLSFLDILTKENIDDIKISTDLSFEILEIFVETSTNIKFSDVPAQIFELALLKSLSIRDAKNIAESNDENSELIFDTEEIIPNEAESKKDDIFEDDNPESIQEKIERTMELTINQDIIENDEESNEIEEEILSQKSFKNTDELNISNLFSSDDTNETETKERKSLFSIDDIINLLIQANKNIHIENKEKWFAKSKLVDSNDRQIVHLLDKTNLISSSDEFILLESEDVYVINSINRIRNDEKTQAIIKKILGKHLAIFAITKEEFEKVKNTWISLSQTDALPKARPIEKPKVNEPVQDDAETFGTSIFGDIFNS